MCIPLGMTKYIVYENDENLFESVDRDDIE